MTIQRIPITVGDGEWAPYSPSHMDGVTTTLDTASGLASVAGVFKATSSDYPLSANTGMACGYIDTAAALPADGVHPAGVCSVRIGNAWYPGLAWLDTSTAGQARLIIQANAAGVIAECAVSIPPFKTVSAS